jgi:hypothetical protein
MNNPYAYSISQIARAAGISRQAVTEGLARVSLASITVDGKLVDGWTFDSLPIDWKMEITRRAVKRGFESGLQFLDSLPHTIWKAPLPWDRVPERERTKAVKLHKALGPALALRADPAMPPGEEVTGLEDFKREFGYPISARQWRRLLARTIERDGGEENWQRLEIYLADRALAMPKPNRQYARNEFHHRELDETLAVLENRESLTAEDRQFLWDAVFCHYEEHTAALTDPAANHERKEFKRSLVRYMFKALPAPILCASFASLKRRFDEKLNHWQSGGRNPQALLDGRHDSSGRTGRKLCATCRPLVVGGAVDCDGDLSQTWRRLQLAGQLCQECAEIGAFDVRRAKSEVPRSVRRDVESDILTALQHRHGPKHIRLVSPYVRRNWGDIGPGDWAECDDMTPNQATHGLVEVLTWDEDKSGRPFVGRMEVLFQIDRRTDYPWGYVIILGDPATPRNPQRKASYSSVHCRLLFLRAHDALGLPHRGGGYYLENGIWSSRLIDGPKVNHWDNSSWQSVELGLKDPRIGLNVRHAMPGNPRSKVIERLFLAIQDRMRCHPGFLGFNERQDKREVASDLIRRVKAGKEHPGNAVPEISEFRNLLDAELMQYASEPQNGDRLPGVSPAEAFQNGIGGKPGIKATPLRQLHSDVRFLLSTHERIVLVKDQGITFGVGNSEFAFWGKELEQFQNKQIIARFNFEEPELLSCQAPDGQLFTVKARILPSSTATKEQLAEAGKARASWTKRGKIIYDNLPHPFRTNITRETEQSETTRAAGRFHNEEVEKFRAEKSSTRRKMTKLQQKAAAAGIELAGAVRNPDDALEAIDRREHFLQAMREEEDCGENASQKGNP